MRNERGFFCSAQFGSFVKREEVWFGPRMDEGLRGQVFENIKSNGLKFFSSQEDAERALKEIKQTRPDLTKHGIVYMAIKIAENEKDREALRKRRKIIILHTTDGGTDLLGPNLSGNDKSSIYPIEAEMLTVNGGKPYSYYPLYTYRETSRQGGKVNLATLVEFRRIK